MQPPVILVIPAWDEAESIGAVLSEVPPELVGEVVVVVGSSADPAAEVAAAHGARIISSPGPAMVLPAGRGRARPRHSEPRSSCSSTATMPTRPWS